MLLRVALVRTNVSEDPIASIARVTRINEIRSMVALPSNRSTVMRDISANVVPSTLILVTLIMEAIRCSETYVLTRGTWRNISEDGILQL
jgi:hypothetical protein